jgi:hypothetical protein
MNMKRFTFMMMILFLVITVSSGKSITNEEARQKAVTFLQQRGLNIQNDIQLKKKCLKKTQTSKKEATYFVFNVNDDKGFVIVSGDDRTAPIIGYTTEGNYDENELPENFKSWIQAFSDQIEALDNTHVTSSSNAVATHSAIAPLLATKWNQSSPYNNKCPLYQGENCVTGCVATAMAQIMNYHKWPQAACTVIPEYTYTLASTKYNMPALPSITFDWSSMKDTYSETDNGDAVATLMLYCGQSVKMTYTTSGSGASDNSVRSALRDYFGYDSNIQYLNRINYKMDEWDQLVYKELENARPIYYSGQSSGGGHAFVCDGYDGKGYYHINWGWGGYCDGYFKLELMNPDGSGIGGSTTADGYTGLQSIITGIQKPTGKDANIYLTGSNLNSSNGNLLCYLTNDNTKDGSFAYGWAEVDEQGNILSILKSDKGTVAKGNGIVYYLTDFSQLSVGTHRITAVSKEDKDGTTWALAIPSASTYMECTKDQSGNITFVCHPIMKVETSGFNISGSNVIETPQHITLNIKNVGDEIHSTLWLYLDTPQGKYYSDIRGLFIKSGDTYSYAYDFRPNCGIGKYKIWLHLDGVGDLCDKTIEVRNPIYKLKVNKIDYEGYYLPHLSQKINVSVSNTSDDISTTLGIHVTGPKGEKYDCSGNSLELQSGKTADSNMTFTPPKSGTYKIQLYSDKIDGILADTSMVIKDSLKEEPKLKVVSYNVTPENDAKIIAKIQNNGQTEYNYPLIFDLYRGEKNATWLSYHKSNEILNPISAGNANEYNCEFDGLSTDYKYMIVISYYNMSGTKTQLYRSYSFEINPTGISEVKTENDSNDNAYYNLNGIKVINPSKGLYIHNGKKIVVK